MFNPQDFRRAAQALCDTGRILYQRGWSPATSSNYSVRLNDQCCALTSSGKHKGELTPGRYTGGRLAGPGSDQRQTLRRNPAAHPAV